jgi:hypothetical protein
MAKQCHKPAMTGNGLFCGKHITCHNGGDWGMVDDFALPTILWMVYTTYTLVI